MGLSIAITNTRDFIHQQGQCSYLTPDNNDFSRRSRRRFSHECRRIQSGYDSAVVIKGTAVTGGNQRYGVERGDIAHLGDLLQIQSIQRTVEGEKQVFIL